MLVDTSAERTTTVEEALIAAGHQVVIRVVTGQGLAAQVTEHSPDVIIVDVDSPDRDTLEQMHTISRERPRPIVMFTNDGDADTIRSAMRAGISAYVVDGLNPGRVLPVLEVAIARFDEFQAMRDELEKTKSSLVERKLIEKAKGILMRQTRMDEEASYKAMRKMAMDRNIKLVDLARTLIAATELLDGRSSGDSK